MTLRLKVTVSPGAGRSAVAGRHDDGWKIRIAATPERGRANRALVELVAEILAVPRNAVRVVSGQTSRRKTIEVDGVTASEADRRLEAASRRAP